MNTHYGISENTLVHEIGHILGYGTIWGLPNVPKSSYIEDGVTKYYWTGENAVREYKNYYTAHVISHNISDSIHVQKRYFSGRSFSQLIF